jgi:hypothetical protein
VAALNARRRHTTVREYMPSSHRRLADWTPARMQRKANEIGPMTSALVEIILREKTHPELGFRTCIGILEHANAFRPRTARRRLWPGTGDRRRSYTSVTSILKTNLDHRRPAPATDWPAITHDNIRGPRYFQ